VSGGGAAALRGDGDASLAAADDDAARLDEMLGAVIAV
jgi:hypothetical protein